VDYPFRFSGPVTASPPACCGMASAPAASASPMPASPTEPPLSELPNTTITQMLAMQRHSADYGFLPCDPSLRGHDYQQRLAAMTSYPAGYGPLETGSGSASPTHDLPGSEVFPPFGQTRLRCVGQSISRSHRWMDGHGLFPKLATRDGLPVGLDPPRYICR